MKQENPQQHHELNEGKRKKSLQSQRRDRRRKLQKGFTGELGQKGLNSGNRFGLSQKCLDQRFCAKGPKICSLLNKWSVCSFRLALIKKNSVLSTHLCRN